MRTPAEEPPPPALPQPIDDELELERDMEYFVGPDEELGPLTPRGDLTEIPLKPVSLVPCLKEAT